MENQERREGPKERRRKREEEMKRKQEKKEKKKEKRRKRKENKKLKNQNNKAKKVVKEYKKQFNISGSTNYDHSQDRVGSIEEYFNQEFDSQLKKLEFLKQFFNDVKLKVRVKLLALYKILKLEQNSYQQTQKVLEAMLGMPATAQQQDSNIN
ncbi:hypothetical protein CsatA_018728 [Cannabis sativa]